MEEVPISAGLQIIDADLLSRGISRVRDCGNEDFDSASAIEEAFRKLHERDNLH